MIEGIPGSAENFSIVVFLPGTQSWLIPRVSVLSASGSCAILLGSGDCPRSSLLLRPRSDQRAKTPVVQMSIVRFSVSCKAGRPRPLSMPPRAPLDEIGSRYRKHPPTCGIPLSVYGCSCWSASGGAADSYEQARSEHISPAIPAGGSDHAHVEAAVHAPDECIQQAAITRQPDSMRSDLIRRRPHP